MVLDDHEMKFVITGGILLSFNAGFVNAISLTGMQTVVSHVTGTTTKAASLLVNGKIPDFLLSISLVISFFLGSLTSGLIIRDQKFKLGRGYGLALFLVAAILFLAFILLNHGWSFACYVLAFACGLQNAMASTYSGAILRTTHMTGIITDLGTLTAQLILQGRKGPDLWKFKIFIPLYCSFFAGGVAGTFMYLQVGAIALCFPVVILGFTSMVYLSSDIVEQSKAKIKEEERIHLEKMRQEAADLVCKYIEENGLTQNPSGSIVQLKKVKNNSLSGSMRIDLRGEADVEGSNTKLTDSDTERANVESDTLLKKPSRIGD